MLFKKKHDIEIIKVIEQFGYRKFWFTVSHCVYTQMKLRLQTHPQKCI